jgi:hypothetical protein
MLRPTLLAALAALPLVYVSMPAGPPAALAQAPCFNVLPQEPVLVYDVTGFTFAGMLVHKHLAVYTNGVASISEAGTSSGPSSKADVAFVGPDKVRKLVADLTGANAFALCDQNVGAADIPLTTVTVARGATDAVAHTFSYWFAGAPYDKVEAVIDAFIKKTFPNF